MKTYCYKALFLLIICTFLSACQTVQYVTKPNYPTEASLVANAYDNGLSTELDMPYLQAYFNLKQAYQRCVAFSTDQALVFTDNRLEQEIELGTLFAKTEHGEFLQKTLVEGLGQNKTRISLFLPKQYKFAKQRFKQDIVRARGQDKACNLGVVIPIQA
ncbi:hypothetical protein D9K79_09835 [Acinetobacter cumulans]|uniref:Lipoprotein n=1 Tax=Acinetobacter cumulans TaxID=2136182 RepID=A0A498CZ17_9GAMM|nr:hypothetical protein [Acinetobacter cumulans]RLL36638.1 hypothetical protein D9K80_05630 [Acinetobacter cumulans]RLL44388.1 hypothetical protein D9K79_09835 [Acinetobacter cumulans]